ncbi:MAG: T9SS type A sorting domain-containing protein [Flavobacteriales bacterium]|nr:T9SS type A sorting domain-containing protein [Flavobacteriales bacterium]
MKTIIKTFYLLMAVVLCSDAFGQTMTIDSGTSIPDPLILSQSSITMYFTVDDQAFMSGISNYNCEMHIGVKDLAGNITVAATKSFIFNTQQTNPYSDTMVFNFGSDTLLNPGAFQLNNGNVVVIWPVPPPAQLQGGIVVDTFEAAVNVVEYPVGIDFLWDGYEEVGIYPIPATTDVTINFGSIDKNELESVVLCDMSGKLIKNFANRDGILNLNEVERGIYLINVELSNDRTKSFKVVLQ